MLDFEERQRRLSQQEKQGREQAMGALHQFQANDKEIVYHGTPEKPARPMRQRQDDITPDATASIYHSPHHHLVVVLQDNQNHHDDDDVDTTTRTYSHHQSCLSPDAKIPMTSFATVARNLMRDEGMDTTTNIVGHDESPVKEEEGFGKQDGEILLPTTEQWNIKVEAIKNGENTLENLASFGSDLLSSENQNNGVLADSVTNRADQMQKDPVQPTITKAPSYELDTFASLGVAILPTKSWEKNTKSKHAPTDTISKAASTTSQEGEDGEASQSLYGTAILSTTTTSTSDAKDEQFPATTALKSSSYELESLASFGMAILPMTKSRSYDDEEEEEKCDTLPFRRSARKVSEGSQIEYADATTSHEPAEESSSIYPRPQDESSSSFASYGVAILPTVSRSYDEQDTKEKDKTMGDPTQAISTCLDVVGRMEAEEQQNEETTTSIFRALSQAEDPDSKISLCGPVVLPITRKSAKEENFNSLVVQDQDGHPTSNDFTLNVESDVVHATESLQEKQNALPSSSLVVEPHLATVAIPRPPQEVPRPQQQRQKEKQGFFHSLVFGMPRSGSTYPHRYAQYL